MGANELAAGTAPEVPPAFASANETRATRGARAGGGALRGHGILESVRNILVFAGLTVTTGLAALVAVLVAARVIGL
jgi:hypothetical protein